MQKQWVVFYISFSDSSQDVYFHTFLLSKKGTPIPRQLSGMYSRSFLQHRVSMLHVYEQWLVWNSMACLNFRQLSTERTWKNTPQSVTDDVASFTQCQYIDDLVQDCSNSIALAMELLQSCTKLSNYFQRTPWYLNSEHTGTEYLKPVSSSISVCNGRCEWKYCSVVDYQFCTKI